MSVQILTARCIADGTTSEVFAGRITLKNGIIQSVERGDFAPGGAEERFFDENKVLCPAFIDAHGHSDISVLPCRKLKAKRLKV